MLMAMVFHPGLRDFHAARQRNLTTELKLDLLFFFGLFEWYAK